MSYIKRYIAGPDRAMEKVCIENRQTLHGTAVDSGWGKRRSPILHVLVDLSETHLELQTLKTN